MRRPGVIAALVSALLALVLAGGLVAGVRLTWREVPPPPAGEPPSAPVEGRQLVK